MNRIVNFFSRWDVGSNLLIVLLLGLGLGTTALLYTALDRLLLHPLRIADPDRLVRVGEVHSPVTSWNWFPYSFYLTMQRMHSFDGLAVEGEVDTAVTSASGTEPAVGSMVSGNYFALLGARAELGRTLSPADDSAATGVPIVLSHGFWVREFAASPAILGTVVHLQGKPFSVVGVMPKRFFGTRLDASPDFWLPLAAQALLSHTPLTDPNPDRDFSIVGRLRPGVTVLQAQSEFAGVYRAARANGEAQSRGLVAPIAEGSFALREQFSRALRLLLWGLAILLSMVCASVAGMLVARAVRRERETAVRMALGATRLKLVRRALIESATLGMLGACTGVGFAYLCAPLLKALLPAGRTPLPVSLFPSLGTDCWIIVLALITSAIFGTIPSTLTMPVMPQLALRGSRATRRSGKLSRGLLVFETGATLILLTATGLLLRTMDRLRHSDPGFDAQHLVSFTLDMNMLAKNGKTSAALPRELEQRVLGLPGVRAAGFSAAEILGRFGLRTSVALPGQNIAAHAFLNTYLNRVSTGFFSALGIPLVTGRELEPQDLSRASPMPVVVNDAFARRFFPGQPPLGKQFGIGETGAVAKAEYVVVGVVGDAKYHSLREAFLPTFYTPIANGDVDGSEIYFYVRTTSQPAGIIRAVRAALFDLDPQIPFSAVQTMQEQMDDSLWQERLLVMLATGFSGISILLAGMGLFGLLAYDAAQRNREFGIRTALGASKQDIARLMIKQLILILEPGLVLGYIGCAALAHMIAPALYGIGPYDTIAWSGALCVLFVTALAALLQPMRRALAADPALVLHEE
jgi:predicted permease